MLWLVALFSADVRLSDGFPSSVHLLAEWERAVLSSRLNVRSIFYSQLLTAMFIDEWNILVREKAGLHALNRTLTLKFQLFGDDYSISFDDLATGTADMHMSVGGTYNSS